MHIIESMEQQKIFQDQLRGAGERVSSPRLAIFQVLVRHSPITVPNLVNLLQEQAVDPSTTYRNITLFRKLGMINDVIANGLRLIELSDNFTEHHHHFICSNCGRVIDFDNQNIENMLSTIAAEIKVEVTSHHLEMRGLCDNCKEYI